MNLENLKHKPYVSYEPYEPWKTCEPLLSIILMRFFLSDKPYKPCEPCYLMNIVNLINLLNLNDLVYPLDAKWFMYHFVHHFMQREEIRKFSKVTGVETVDHASVYLWTCSCEHRSSTKQVATRDIFTVRYHWFFSHTFWRREGISWPEIKTLDFYSVFAK